MPPAARPPLLQEARLLPGHKGSVNVALFNSDGNYCLSGGDDRRILLWNPRREEAAEPIKTYTGHNERVLGLAVAHDNGSFASCGGDRSVFVWDVPSGRVLRRLSGHSQRVNAVAYAGEGSSLLVSASYDTTARCWDMRSRNAAPVQILEGAADSLSAVAVCGAEILTASVDGVLRTYDARAGSRTADTLGAALTHVALSGDGHCALAGSLDGSLRLLDRSNGTLLNRYSGHTNRQFKLGACLSHDDALVLSGSEDGSLYVSGCRRGGSRCSRDQAAVSCEDLPPVGLGPGGGAAAGTHPGRARRRHVGGVRPAPARGADRLPRWGCQALHAGLICKTFSKICS